MIRTLAAAAAAALLCLGAASCASLPDDSAAFIGVQPPFLQPRGNIASGC
jgi:hypothetical protein